MNDQGHHGRRDQRRGEWGHEPRLMVHEAALTAVLASIWFRLAASQGWLASASLTYAALTLAVPAVAAAASASRRCWDGRWNGPWPGRLRLFACFPLITFVFEDLRSSLPLFHPAHVDALLQSWDVRLLGRSVPHWFDGRLGRVATEALSLCYGLFFAYLLAALTGWLFAPPAKARAFCGGLFTLYAAGFLGYTVLPALGPYATMGFAHPVQGFGATRLLLHSVPLGTNRADAFPSLHCAVTAFIFGFDLIAGRRPAAWRRALCCAPPAAGLFLSTVALRFHYAVDVLAGFSLAGLCLALAAALLRPNLAWISDPVPSPPIRRHPPASQGA